MEIREMVKQTNGKFFKVEFFKKDGSLRKMVCRTKVTKYIKGTGNAKSAIQRKLITVFDVQKKEYRCFYPETVISFKCGSTQYKKD